MLSICSSPFFLFESVLAEFKTVHDTYDNGDGNQNLKYNHVLPPYYSDEFFIREMYDAIKPPQL